jgi:hypothetical protein
MDVYALGVLAFELATGSPPFGGTVHVLAHMPRQPTLPRASTLNPAVPPELDDLIARMLAPEPAERPSALAIGAALTGSASQPRPVRRAGRFVGRSADLARLDAAITRNASGTRLVVVTGPSGAGKSALVDESLGRVRIRGAMPAFVWRGRCHERERVPYRAFDFVIDDLAAELAGDDRLAVGLEHAGALGRVFPSLGAVLGAGPPVGDLRVERERALVAMTQLFDRVMANQGGLIAIDDLQWADDDSLELLALLVERVSRPLTIIATWMSDNATPARLAALFEEHAGRIDHIALAPLGPADTLDLVAAIAPLASSEQIRTAARQSAGSPYLAELIARELAEHGRAELDQAEARRLARRPPAEREIAELIALASGVSTFEQLRAVAEIATSSVQLHSLLRALEDDRIVRVSPSASGDPVYTLYHERLRVAADAAIAPDVRRERHARFAQLLERQIGPADQLAYHHEHAGNPERAAFWARTAAERARAQLAWSIAAGWYARAVALGETSSRADLAECLFLAGKLAAAAVELEALAHERGDMYRVRAAEAHIKLGNLERGLALVDEVLARHGEPRPKSRALGALRTVGVTARWLTPGRRTAPHDEVIVATYRVIASFLSTPYPVAAFEYVMRGLAAAEQSGDRDAYSLGMAMLAAYLGVGSLGRFGDRALGTAHRVAATSGAAYPRMVTAGAAGILATLRGEWDAMRRAHAEGQRICKRLGLDRSWEASFLRTYQGLGEYYAGEPARALAILGEVAGTSDDLISRALLGSCRGRALLIEGDLATARSLQRELVARPTAGHGLAAIYRDVFAAELALAEGDWLRAEAIALELARAARAQWLSVLPAVSAMIDTVVATAQLGRAQSRRSERAIARRARARARALYRRGKHSFYAATALRLWGQAEHVLGDHRSAAAVLSRAAGVAAARGGKVDRVAIAALTGTGPRSSELAFAVHWATAGMIER